MALFLSSIPFFDCLVRKEYTRDLRDGHGSYYSAKAVGIRCQRGRMPAVQCVLDGFNEVDAPVPTGGAMFIVPLCALASRPCEAPKSEQVSPWDCLSDTFSIVTLELLSEMKAHVLPSRLPGRYIFTIQYGRSDLADDPTQHKQHHLCRLDAGWFGCFPNNRLLLDDGALFRPTTEKPDFLPLSHTFSAE